MGIETWDGAAVLLGYLATFLVHSTLLIAATWVLLRLVRSMGPGLRERVWRVALLGAVVTAAVPAWTGLEPLGGRLGLPSRVDEVGVASAPAPDLGSLSVPLEMASHALQQGGADTPLAAWATGSAAGSQLGWVSALTLFWALGAIVGVTRLLLAHRRLHRDLDGRRTVSLGPAARSLARLERGRAPVRLSSSTALAVPIAFGVWRPEICLCERALAELSPRELDATLAHELGHLVRRDPLWLALAHVLCALFWFQPLLIGVRRELTRLAELQADRFAARQTGEPLALASALTRVAAWWSPSPVAAHAMAGARFALAERVECLLDGRAVQSAGRGALATPLAAVLLAALVTGAPAVSAVSLDHGAKGLAPVSAGAAKSAGAGEAGAAGLQREIFELELELAELGLLLERHPAPDELAPLRAEFAQLLARLERIEFLREELETLLFLRAARPVGASASDVPNVTEPLPAAQPFAP